MTQRQPVLTSCDPVVLEGERVRLVPLSAAHVSDLARVGLAPTLWRWVPTQVTTEGEMGDYVLAALEEQRRGMSLPFAIEDRASGDIIGSTRFANIELVHRRVEIGWTWLTPSHQRTGANREAKVLMLAHAFEVLGVHRVEFKTDALNMQSRHAIERLGALQEGIFRKHMVMPKTGRVRDTVYFSILDHEWPEIRTRLRRRLDDHHVPA